MPAAAQWLLVATIPLATAQSAQLLLEAMAQARSQAIPLALDVNWRPTFWDAAADPAAGPTEAACSAIRPLLEWEALIKLAREEALWFFADDDPRAISSGLPQQPDVVVTDGAAPVSWCIGGESGSQPASPPPQALDTKGAADAFTAGLLHRLFAPVAERLRFAAACGALVCAGAGALIPSSRRLRSMRFWGASAERFDIHPWCAKAAIAKPRASSN